MKTPRKSKVTHEQSLLGQLSKPLRDIVDDIRAHGPDALRKVREESPVKYLELVTKVLPIIAALDPGRSDWSECQSMEDIGRRLLTSVGFEDEDRMD